MAQISITVPTDKVQEVVDAFRAEFGDVEGLTDAQMVKHHIKEFVKRVHRTNAERIAIQTHIQPITNDNTIVSD